MKDVNELKMAARMLYGKHSRLRWNDGDEGDGSGGDEGDPGDKGGGGLSPEDVKALQDKVAKQDQDLEDLRAEVLTPEYIDFLNKRGKEDEGKDKDKGDAGAGEKDLEKMSKKELIELMREGTKKDIDAVKKMFEADKKAQSEKEVANFARTHDDFELYRPTMYGLSIDPKNNGKSLDELYSMAKEHHKKTHTEPTEEEKKKSRKAGNEKPGSGSDSYEKDKNKSDAELNAEAWDETVAKLDGEIPIS